MNDQTTMVIQSLARDVGELQERIHHMEMMFMQLLGGLAEAGIIQVADGDEEVDASARGTSDVTEVEAEEETSRIILP